jgi:two-component system, OmpR family, sensor histidine kinase QseC
MMSLFRPTLVRRVVIALLLAFAAVWVVLLGGIYMSATSQAVIDKGLQDVGQGLVMALSRLDQPGEARAVAEATSNQINHLYRTTGTPALMLVQLNDQLGARLFLSAEAGGAVLPAGDTQQIAATVLNGRDFRVFYGSANRWRITVAGSPVSKRWLLISLGKDLSLYMLVAFPCILLPLWLAVSRGLRPLQRLSDRIAERSADDLSPTGIAPKYAELKPLVVAFDRFLAQLRAKIAREQGFVQDAAHELRTPLAVIAVQAHVLTMESDADGRREAAHQLDNAIGRASHLVGQLLELARVDSARAQEAQSIDVAQLVREELAHMARMATENALELSLEAPDELPFTLDVHAFRSVLLNLLGNALHYVPAGGRIAVALQQAEGSLTLSVSDDGPGIAESDKTMIFERFYRGKTHDKPGSGLGLAIVKQAAIRLNGTVQLLSGLDGRGCAFVVGIAPRTA